MIQVRHSLNDYLLSYGGHIGYSVRASERRKGYESIMLKNALAYCQSIGLGKVLITCEKSNLGSAAVIKSGGGKLENELTDDIGAVYQRYWIYLS